VSTLSRSPRWSHDEESTAFQLRHERRGLWLLSPGGDRLIDLLPVILVRQGRPRAGVAFTTRRLRFRRYLFRNIADGWRGSAEVTAAGARYTVQIAHRRGEPWLRLELEASYDRSFVTHKEALRLSTGPLHHVEMVDRAQRLVPVRSAHHVGSLTPHRAVFHGDDGQVSLAATEGFQGLKIAPIGRSRFAVELELEHHKNHPFRLQRTCEPLPRLRPPRTGLWGSARCAGQTLRASATLALGPAMLLSVGRYPRGLRSALAFTDHADQSSRARFEAFAFGESGAVDRGQLGSGHAGFVNRGLGYTKTVFIRKSRGYWSQLDNPGYRDLLDLASERGVEIGVHSPTGRQDLSHEVRELLSVHRALFPGRTWIDHQPDTNCEAITSQGWRRGSRHYVLHHLHELGYRYLWSTLELPLPRGSLNILAPDRPGLRRPVLYRHNLGGCSNPEHDFLLFSTTPLFFGRARLLRLFSARNLDRLANENGLIVGHVYLDFHRRGRLSNRSLLEAVGTAHFRLRPEVDRLFQRLAARQSRGDLWVTGVERLADHLTAAMKVRFHHLPEGLVQVSNPGRHPLRDLTLLIPIDRGQVTVDGGPTRGTRHRAGVSAVWFDLGPGETRELRLRDHNGRPARVLTPARVVLLP
jgi:hypothetical protein